MREETQNLNSRTESSASVAQAARRQAWASFRAAEEEGFYNVAPTESLIVGDVRKVLDLTNTRILVSCSDGRAAEFFEVNFKGKFQTQT